MTRVKMADFIFCLASFVAPGARGRGRERLAGSANKHATIFRRSSGIERQLNDTVILFPTRDRDSSCCHRATAAICIVTDSAIVRSHLIPLDVSFIGILLFRINR